jgi:hypothetical protein
MRLYWHGLGSKNEPPWNDGAEPDPVRQSREERKVTKLQDVKNTFHTHMDGFIAPTLLADQWQQLYLDVVAKSV